MKGWTREQNLVIPIWEEGVKNIQAIGILLVLEHGVSYYEATLDRAVTKMIGLVS